MLNKDTSSKILSFCSSRKKYLAAVTALSASIFLLASVILYSSSSSSSNGELSVNPKDTKFLKQSSKPFSSTLKFHHSSKNYMGNKHCPYIENLKFDLKFDSSTEFTFKIDDAKSPRFRLPDSKPFPFTKVNSSSSSPGNADQQFSVSFKKQESKIAFVVRRTSTDEILFDTSAHDFVYSNKYLELSTDLPTKYFYGMGERTHDLLYKDGNYTIWPFDQFGIVDDGILGNQTYGYHPVYLMREKSGNYHVVYLRNFNAMSFEFHSNKPKLTYRTTGGLFEFKFFLGDKYPETALKQYHSYINKWTIQPFWSFGYHQCRWGYKSSDQLLSVVDSYQKHDIPLDVVWSDIDYMIKYQTFTVNSDNFHKSHFDSIFSKKVRWVPIFDYGIKVEDNLPYHSGVSKDIFIKSAVTGKDLINCVWPGTCVFPDFNHPNTTEYWEENLKALKSQFSFDGIWNDMNEIATFRTGEVAGKYDQCWENGPDWGQMGQSRLFLSYELPYLPFPPGRFMESRTISMTAERLGNGKYISVDQSQGDHHKIVEENVHPLNGLLQSVTLYEAMKASMDIELPFILTRSSAPGSGSYAVHWTGDNLANWRFLRYSIADILSFQIYGMPVTGSDICGFMGHTNEELCARWFQIGAFYPFARNHNHNDARSQEAYAFGVESAVFKAAKVSLKLRYSLLKYFYALHLEGEGVGALVKPMFFEFPDEERFFGNYQQFMFGRALMIAPALHQGQKEVKVQIPEGTRFVELIGGAMFEGGGCKNISAPLELNAPVFLREGFIVQMQNVDRVKTTNDLSSFFNLKIFLTPIRKAENENFLIFGDFEAKGVLLAISDYNSSSIVQNCSNGNSCLVSIVAKGTTTPNQSNPSLSDLNLTISFSSVIDPSISFDKFSIFGLRKGDKSAIVESLSGTEYRKPDRNNEIKVKLQF